MKQVKFKMPLRALALAGGLFLSATTFAQSTLKGTVKDASGEPLIGATVTADGKTIGVTDFDGNFSVQAPQGTDLTITYIGMAPQTVKAGNNMVVVMKADDTSLNEVVVIGYGSVKKSDLTGSVTALRPDSKNKGLVVNPQDLIAGKIAGVGVTSASGAPGAGANIRIRGGSSLNASNDPLIVIDGVPMDNNGVKGLSNPLSMINPQDIESFNVLKDASATAIYGSRGSNGVIIITTKKGHKNQAPTVSYSGSFTVSQKKKGIDVMTGDEFRSYVAEHYGKESEAYAALGKANTDWQDEIYRTALSHDHNLTVSGAFGDFPYRVSAGYTNEQGILKTSSFERATASVVLNPSLLNDHLVFNLNGKGMWAKSKYANTDAIGAAVWMDPTQSIYDNTSSDAKNFNNYFAWKTGAAYGDAAWPNTINSNATKNPVALLNGKDDHAISRSFVGSADVDYKIHGFEDLHLHATGGIDLSQGRQTTTVANWSPSSLYYGSDGFDKIFKRSLTFSAYAQYSHDFKDKASNHFDIMAGYEYQHFYLKQTKRYYGTYPSTSSNAGQRYEFSGAGNGYDYDGDGVIDDYRYETENYLVSFFGRANWSLMDGRYIVTATVRDDGASRFKDHWALFPSAAFAWKIKDENKFRDMKWLSDLKMRLSWGMTGQQEGIGDYSYFATYAYNAGSNGYYPIVGDGTLSRPDGYNPDLKWETTTTYNIGLDWGLFNQHLTGSIDWYYRKTTNLINYAYVPAGTTFANQVNKNIGSLYNSGVEVQLHWLALNTKDWTWTLDYNFTYNKNRITSLIGNDPSYYVATGSISSGTGQYVQAHAVGHPASSFYVYQQVYDKNGKPLEGVYVDRNGDGVITEKDKYFYKSPTAPVTMGFASRLEYKNWDLGFSLRASIGNYVYNDLEAGASNCSTSIWTSYNYMSNRPKMVLDRNWQTYDNPLSDYFVHNASFLKMDNITLGYSFDKLFKGNSWNGISGRIYGTVNNVFTLTNYNGIDPEVFGGIDNNMYPRPISFIVGLNLNF